ncbi:uncharacterized protein N7482_010427 [Penicillium canariense]|uniref:Uncharacterized protein n=1 Tax=Penicillium canariense TaxID=189055 RepID=A0A9W9LEH4_9EURO|nr:uncharacterized protein N7482_010427 [Penicillium canariense]KAJ5151175.1 hypothetical protein N7482_010427 [Penicillium canariense]
MFNWLKDFFAGNASTEWRRKRANRAYHRKVRARERQLRRHWNHEDVANRFFYWAPYSSERPTKDAVKDYRTKQRSTRKDGGSSAK